MSTQNIFIAEHLRSGKSITPLEALNLYGCFRLGARIFELQHEPYNMNIFSDIVTDEKTGKRFASYSLVE